LVASVGLRPSEQTVRSSILCNYSVSYGITIPFFGIFG
jgi:hypothetical protein